MAGYLNLATSFYDCHLSILHLGIVCDDCHTSDQRKHSAQVPSHRLGSLQTGLTSLAFALLTGFSGG